MSVLLNVGVRKSLVMVSGSNMYKMVHCDLQRGPTKVDGLWTEDTIGSYNVAPIGWRAISHKEFAIGHFMTYSPTHLENRQLHRTIDGESIYGDDGYMIACTLYFFSDGTGYAMEVRQCEKDIRFYAFGCDHEMEHVANVGNCLNTYACTKCEYRPTHDSSD